MPTITILLYIYTILLNLNIIFITNYLFTVFLYPPHRGCIIFVNTCGMHRNIDLRPYDPMIASERK